MTKKTIEELSKEGKLEFKPAFKNQDKGDFYVKVGKDLYVKVQLNEYMLIGKDLYKWEYLQLN